MGGITSKNDLLPSNEFGWIKLEPKKSFIYQNEPIEGFVRVKILKPFPGTKLYIYVHGQEAVKFGKNEVGSHNICNEKFLIKSRSLEIGQYKFSYKFRFSGSLIPTFCYRESKGVEATVRYHLVAVFESTEHEITDDLSIGEELFIKSQMDSMISPGDMYTIKSNKERQGCCGSRGHSALTCLFAKDYLYQKHQDMKISVRIDNQIGKDDIKKVKCELIRYIDIKSNKGVVKSIVSTLLSSDFEYEARAGSFGPQVQAYLSMPAMENTIQLPDESGKFLHPTMRCKLITCRYQVNLTIIYVEGCCVCGVPPSQAGFSVNIYSPVPSQHDDTLNLSFVSNITHIVVAQLPNEANEVIVEEEESGGAENNSHIDDRNNQATAANILEQDLLEESKLEEEVNEEYKEEPFR